MGIRGDLHPVFFTLLLSTMIFTVVWSAPGSQSGFKRSEGSKCKQFDPVDINDTWFLKEGEIGFNFPIGSKLQTKGGQDFASPAPQDDKSLQVTNCWTVFTKVLRYILPIDLVANFNRTNQAKAVLRTERTPAVADIFKFYGDFTIVLTDNQTFALFYGCLYERKEFWMVMVPEKASFSDENKEKVLTLVDKELKLSRDEEDVTSDKDMVRFMGATINDCAKSEASGNMLAKRLSEGVATLRVPAAGGPESAPAGSRAPSSKKDKGFLGNLFQF